MNIRKAKNKDVEKVILLTKIPEFDNPNSVNNLESVNYFKEYVKKRNFPNC